MIPHYQIPRNTLLWLFASQVLVLLPHIQRIPLWITALLLFCMIWRVQVFRGHWSFPAKPLKVMVTLSCCVGLVVSFPAFFSLEALVGTLFVGYGLKLLEMYYKRDALIVLYLSFFLLMTEFLFEQGIVIMLLSLIAFLVVLASVIGLYQHGGCSFPDKGLRKSFALVAQALPLMVLMFIVLPRLPSFWHLPMNKNTPKTGMSDSMSPGDFSRLTQSADPVMRITFYSDVPVPEERYWRGLIFSYFDGRRWRESDGDKFRSQT